jgi:hypothetical protein
MVLPPLLLLPAVLKLTQPSKAAKDAIGVPYHVTWLL